MKEQEEILGGTYRLASLLKLLYDRVLRNRRAAKSRDQCLQMFGRHPVTGTFKLATLEYVLIEGTL